MAEFRDRTFGDGEVVDIDGNRFINCRFEGARLRYAGGVHPYFEECGFGGAGWYFDDAALRTIQFLQEINGAPGGGIDTIKELFTPGNYIKA